ncbi:MAG: CHAT domain-containing protein, partial [Candidatus Sericytochromatia bacterium]
LITGDRSDNQKQALEAYRNALQGFEAINDTQELAACQMNLGVLYQKLITGDRSDNQIKALNTYSQALKRFEAINDTPSLAICQMNLGNLYTQLLTGNHSDNLQKALNAYTVTSELAEDIDLIRKCANNIKRLNLPAASKYTPLMNLIHKLESYRRMLLPQERYSLLKQTPQVYQYYIQACYEDQHTHNTLELAQVIEMTHQRAFLDSFQTGRILIDERAVESTEAKQLIEALNKNLIEYSQVLNFYLNQQSDSRDETLDDEPEIHRYPSLYLTLNDAAQKRAIDLQQYLQRNQELTHRIIELEPSLQSRFRQQSGEVFSPDQLQAALAQQKQSLVIQFYLDQGLLMAISHSYKGSQLHVLDWNAENQAVLLRYYEIFEIINQDKTRSAITPEAMPQIANEPDRYYSTIKDLEGVLSQLYNLLLKPLEAQLNDFEKVTIIPYSSLYNVPFQALYPQNQTSGDPAFLLKNKIVTKMPTLSAWVTLVEQSHSTQKSSSLSAQAWVISDYADPLQSLPGVKTEVKIVQKIFSSSKPMIKQNEEATPTSLKDILRSPGQVLHLAGHATKPGIGSAIILSDGM